MKVLKKIMLAATLLCSVTVKAQTYFTEGFESGAKPSGWSEVYVSGIEPWRYRNGGHSPDDNNWLIPAWEVDITRNPPLAHGGTYNAIFFKQSTNNERTKLVTKVIDLSQGIQPELSFWLCQVPWTFSGNTNWDILRVYYKNSFAGSWTLLAEYLDPISEWTQLKINLPNPNATYYIAFEGQTRWGFGTCIDDIAIEEKGLQPRYVSELIVNQADYTYVPSGSLNEPILNFRFKVFGNTGTTTLNTLSIKSLNTNDADINTNGVKLYKTLTAQFDANNPVGTGGNFSNGNITFNNLNLVLPNGYSYLWLNYDVKSSATHGNLLDAMLEPGSIQVNDSLYPKTAESPVGNRVIYEAIYRQDFEGVHGWTLNGEFQVNTPLGKGGLFLGYPDPTIAYSGSKVLGTDLTGLGVIAGDYENNITENQAYKAISPTINSLFYKDLRVMYHRYLNIEVWDKATVDVSKDAGSSWNNLWYDNNYFTDQLWSKTSHDVPSSLSRSTQLKFMFKLGPTDGGSTYSGWNVDDFIVTGDYITKDVGVVEWVYPKSGCGNSATDSVVVMVANSGAAASPSSIPIQYSFDNGVTWVTNFINQSIAPGDTIDYTFTTKVNLSAPGLRYVKARTKLTGDEDASNDEISTQVYLVPTYSLPFTEQFEGNDGYWRSFGTSLWQWGLATKPSMSGSSKSWITSLTQNYGDALTGKTDTLYSDDFEINNGWSLTGEFEIDTVVFISDTIPTYTFSGLSCLGTDLSRLGSHKGMYENGISWTATSSAIDISNYNALQLRFYRWFKVMEGDTAKIEASNNDTNWTTLWSNSGLANTTDDTWIETLLAIPDSLANGSTLKIRFSITTNSDDIVAEGLNVENLMVTGNRYLTDFAYLQSPCFDLTGVTMPVIDLNVFNHSEAGVDGASLYYSINNGDTWNNVSNSDTHDSYWNWYADSLVSSLGNNGWNGLDNQMRRSRHLLPSALANQSRVIFRVGFKSDKANNDFGGNAIDNVNLYEAPFDVGVESILSPTSTCDLSDQQTIQLRIKNYGVRDMKSDDTVVVAINVLHPMISDNQTDKIVLSSAFTAGSTMDYNISKKFNMSISGSYDVTAYTDIETDPVFYSPTSNNTAIATITVQKPYVELGGDIYTYTPETITLDATNPDPLVTYKWYKAPDRVTVIETNATLTVTDHDGGKYYATLLNTIPCTATDSITVHRLIRDVGIPSFESPISSCELSATTPFRVNFKNFGTDTLTNGDEISLSYIFNGGAQIDSTWEMDRTLLPGDSLVFTFDTLLNMQSIGAYTLKAWATVLLDENATNNATDLTINVWGYPSFDLRVAMGLPKDSVEVFNISYTVDAGIWNAYLWSNDNSTNQTYNMTGTGWAVVTVFDNHACPATDSLFIDLKFADVGVETVLSPISACEVSETVYPHIVIKNMGTDTLTSGTDINLKYYFNSTIKESPTLTLDDELPPNATRDIIFGIGVDISPVGNYNFDFVASTLSDSKSENDSIHHLVSVYGYPTLELGNPIFTRNASYTIDAGSGCDSYSWSTGATTQQITVNQTNEYKVVAVKNSCSAKDSLVVTFLRHNYAISQIVNPITSCSTTSPQAITLKYANVGNDTIKSGEQVKFGYQIDEDYYAEENYTLISNLYPGQYILYSFNDKIDLSVAGNKHVVAYGIYADDINTSDDTLTVDVEIKATPIVNLGVDRVIRTEQETLDGSEGVGYTYSWQDNSTNRFFIVENTGVYWVTTTASNGCFDRDTVSIKSLRPDYRVSSIVSPVSACSLTNAEQIQVEIENVGTDTLFVGQTIYVSYEVNDTLEQTQPITMTQNFRPSEKLTHTFSKTYNMQSVGTYNLKAYTTYSLDINPLNNSSTTIVYFWSLPAVNLGVDRSVCLGSSTILDAENPSSAYLWSTSATTQTIEVSPAFPTDYWVEVTDSHGCKNRDTVTISVNSLPVVTHSVLAPVCLNAASITLSGGNPIGGIYSGLGVSGTTTFTPTTAGVGTHTLTYLYTDINGCANAVNVDITVNALPVVDLESDRNITTPTVLNAGVGFVSYLWSTGETTQTITVNSTDLYWVTVTDANTCQGYDEVNITWQEISDIRATQLISPTSNCFNYLGQTVTATLTNIGTRTFNIGESINVSYWVGTNTPVTETKIFSSTLASGESVNYTFNQKALINSGDVTMYLKTIIAGVDGQATNYPVTIFAIPLVNLGSDRNITGPTVLDAGPGFISYTWQDGSHFQTDTATATGKYWVTVIDSHSCQGYYEVNLTLINDVEIIPGSNARVTLFPNPVTDELTISIEADKNEEFNIDLVSPQGQIVKNLKTDRTLHYSNKIDVNGFTPGVYFIKVSTSKGSAVFKLVIQR